MPNGQQQRLYSLGDRQDIWKMILQQFELTINGNFWFRTDLVFTFPGVSVADSSAVFGRVGFTVDLPRPLRADDFHQGGRTGRLLQKQPFLSHLQGEVRAFSVSHRPGIPQRAKGKYLNYITLLETYH